MDSDARAADSLYVTNKALARIEGLVAAGDVEFAVATLARRAMEAVLSDADAVWQARDSVRRSFSHTHDSEEHVVVAAAAAIRTQAAPSAPMGFHEPERPVEKLKSRNSAGKTSKRKRAAD